MNESHHLKKLQWWKDEYLTWDPSQFNGITKIKVPSSKVWMPDVMVKSTRFVPNKLQSLALKSESFIKFEFPTGVKMLNWAYGVKICVSCFWGLSHNRFALANCELHLRIAECARSEFCNSQVLNRNSQVQVFYEISPLKNWLEKSSQLLCLQLCYFCIQQTHCFAYVLLRVSFAKIKVSRVHAYTKHKTSLKLYTYFTKISSPHTYTKIKIFVFLRK